MIAKLFALYPPRPDTEATMMAYLEETQRLHPMVLSHALHRLTTQEKRGEFLPSCYEILRAAAKVVREHKRKRLGLAAQAYNPWAETNDEDIDIDRWLGEQADLTRTALPAQTETRGDDGTEDR